MQAAENARASMLTSPPLFVRRLGGFTLPTPPPPPPRPPPRQSLPSPEVSQPFRLSFYLLVVGSPFTIALCLWWCLCHFGRCPVCRWCLYRSRARRGKLRLRKVSRRVIARANGATWPAHGGSQRGTTEVVKLAAQDDLQSSESSRAMEGGQPTRAGFSVSCEEGPGRSGSESSLETLIKSLPLSATFGRTRGSESSRSGTSSPVQHLLPSVSSELIRWREAQQQAAAKERAVGEAAEKAAAERSCRAAACKGDLATLSHLVLERGVDVDATDEAGFTALMMAAARGHCDCVDSLLAMGADVNAQTKPEGGSMTSLQLAVALGEHAPCAEPLIRAGADPSLKNTDGDTALDLVKRMGYKETARLLENGCVLQHRHRLNVHDR